MEDNPPTPGPLSVRPAGKRKTLLVSLGVAALVSLVYLLLGGLAYRLPKAYGEQFLEWAGPFEGLPPEGVWNAQGVVLHVLVCVLVLLLLYFLAKLAGQKLRFYLGRITEAHHKSLAKNMVFYFAVFLGLNVLLLSLFDLGRFVEGPPGPESVPTNLLGNLLAFFFVAAVGPFFEEVVFRGFLYARLRSAFSFWPAFLVSGMFFSLLHFDPAGSAAFNAFNIFNIFIFSYFVTKTFEETGNLWNAVIFHGIYNGWVTVVTIVSETIESLSAPF